MPIRTNPQTRESRLFKGINGYIKRSLPVIIRSFLTYKPLRFFVTIGVILLVIGLIPGIRFLIFYFSGNGEGHIQSLLLATISILAGFQTITLGLLADIIAANRKLIEDIQYRVRKIECSQLPDQQHEKINL